MSNTIECSHVLLLHISRIFDADKLSVLILTASCIKTREEEDKLYTIVNNSRCVELVIVSSVVN